MSSKGFFKTDLAGVGGGCIIICVQMPSTSSSNEAAGAAATWPDHYALHIPWASYRPEWIVSTSFWVLGVILLCAAFYTCVNVAAGAAAQLDQTDQMTRLHQIPWASYRPEFAVRKYLKWGWGGDNLKLVPIAVHFAIYLPLSIGPVPSSLVYERTYRPVYVYCTPWNWWWWN
jgi:hypothetical protein